MLLQTAPCLSADLVCSGGVLKSGAREQSEMGREGGRGEAGRDAYEKRGCAAAAFLLGFAREAEMETESIRGRAGERESV
jgi:hypothetical protein